MINELTIRNDLKEMMDTYFNAELRKSADIAGISNVFTVNNFSLAALGDSLLEHDYVGIIHIINSEYAVQPINNNSAEQEIDYSIQVIFPDDGDWATDVSLVRDALAKVVLNSDYRSLALNASADIKITSTQPESLDFSADGGGAYTIAGIIVTIKIGY